MSVTFTTIFYEGYQRKKEGEGETETEREKEEERRRGWVGGKDANTDKKTPSFFAHLAAEA